MKRGGREGSERVDKVKGEEGTAFSRGWIAGNDGRKGNKGSKGKEGGREEIGLKVALQTKDSGSK